MLPKASEQIEAFKSHISRLQFTVNESAYLLSMKWLRKWYSAVGYFPSNNKPETKSECPPIDNSDLFLDDGKNLRPLMEGIDFFVLKKNMWDLFFQWYGGGPEIKVPIVFDPIQKQNIPDLRLLNLIIIYSPNLIFNFKTDNFDSTDSDSKVKTIPIQFSRYKSIQSLCDFACETLKTDSSKFIICQFTSHNQNTRTDNQSIVPNSIEQKKFNNSKSLLENHISDGQQLVLYLNLETSEALKLHNSPEEKELEQLFIDEIAKCQIISPISPFKRSNRPTQKNQKSTSSSSIPSSASMNLDHNSILTHSNNEERDSFLQAQSTSTSNQYPVSTSMSFVDHPIVSSSNQKSQVSKFDLSNSDSESEGSEIIKRNKGSQDRLGYLTTTGNNPSSFDPKQFQTSNVNFTPVNAYHGSKSYITRGPQKQIGLCGFVNLGNTCFFNSSLQCILHTMPFVSHFLDERWRNELSLTNKLGTKGAMANAFAQIVERVWNGLAMTITPRQLFAVIQRYGPQFSGYNQQDAHELLLFLLDMIHEDLNRVKARQEAKAREEQRRVQMKQKSKTGTTSEIESKTRKSHHKHKKKGSSCSTDTENNKNEVKDAAIAKRDALTSSASENQSESDSHKKNYKSDDSSTKKKHKHKHKHATDDSTSDSAQETKPHKHKHDKSSPESPLITPTKNIESTVTNEPNEKEKGNVKQENDQRNDANNSDNENEVFNGDDFESAQNIWNNYISHNDSIVVDSFHGLLRSKLRCPKCKKDASIFEPFVSISLPISGSHKPYAVVFVPFDPSQPQQHITLPIPQKASLQMFETALFTELGRSCRVIYANVTEAVLMNSPSPTETEETKSPSYTMSKSRSMSSLSSNDYNQEVKSLETAKPLPNPPISKNPTISTMVSYSVSITSVEVVNTPQPPTSNTKTYVLECPETLKYCAICQLGVKVKNILNKSNKLLNDLYVIEVPNENPSQEEMLNECMKKFGYLWDHENCTESDTDDDTGSLSVDKKKTGKHRSTKHKNLNFRFCPELQRFLKKKEICAFKDCKTRFKVRTTAHNNHFPRYKKMPFVSYAICSILINGKFMTADYGFNSHHLFRPSDSSHMSHFKPQRKEIGEMNTAAGVYIPQTPKSYFKKKLTLQSLLQTFVSPTLLDEKNQWYCPTCKEFVCADKKLDIWSVPKCFIIHFKRFTAKKNSTGYKKVETNIDFDDYIDLSPYVWGPQNPQSSPSNQNQMLLYKLYAVVHHNGQLNSGHYTAHSYVESQKKWFYFNDTTVKESTQQAVHQSSAYILFYQRVEE